MLRLFQSIFGRREAQPGRYPEDLVERAVERAVDAVDARLRTVGGYRRRLREPAVAGIDHVIALVEGLPPRVEASRAAFDADPRLPHFFASVRRLPEVFGNDPALREFLKDPLNRARERAFALLAMQRQDRTVFGTERAGDRVQREVLQHVVDFAGHRLLDPDTDEEQASRALMRRAFDHLLSLALRDVLAERARRGGLEREQRLMRRKLETLRSGNWGLEATPAEGEPSAADLEQEVARIDAELEGIGPRTGTLERELEVLADGLARSRERLWHGRERVIIDREGVRREVEGDGARAVELDEVHNDQGETIVVLPVSVPIAEVPEPEDAIARARRVLG